MQRLQSLERYGKVRLHNLINTVGLAPLVNADKCAICLVSIASLENQMSADLIEYL